MAGRKKRIWATVDKILASKELAAESEGWPIRRCSTNETHGVFHYFSSETPSVSSEGATFGMPYLLIFLQRVVRLIPNSAAACP